MMSNILPDGVWLLAQRAPIDYLGQTFRARQAGLDVMDLVWGATILIGFVLIMFLLTRLLSKQDKQRPFHHPRRLFNELCQAHRLDRHQRAFLRRLSQYHRAPMPAMIFLQPGWLDPSRLPEAWKADQSRCAGLYDRLFAVDEGSAKKNGTPT